MPKYILCLSAAWLMMALPLSAQEDDTKPAKPQAAAESGDEQEDDSPSAKLEQLEKDQKAQQRALRKRSRELRKEVEGNREDFMKAMQEVQDEMKPETDRITIGVLEVAAMAEEDEDTSLKAIGIVLSQPETEFQEKAGALLVKYHANNDGVVKVLSGIRMPTQASYDLFGAVIENTESDGIRAKASFALMNFVVQASEMAPMFSDDPQIAKTYPAMAEFMKSETVAGMNEESLMEGMKELADKYGDVELEEGSTIGEMVARKIKAIEIRSRVAVGKVAPDIAGPDIDGEEFKLSDYRGKVVMLDFWGDW